MCRASLSLAGIAASLGLSVSAASQAAPPQKPAVPIAPVEVVATRLPESPHEVPASIEVISGADLRARGVVSLKDALALAAGVSIAPGGDHGPASAVPEFWGLREFDAFLLVVDGIPWGGAFNPALATLSLRDVERIEILRGPAPVTYGATSFVGVIHVVHSAAAADAKYVTASGGTFGSASASIDVAVPLVGDWKSRVSGDFDNQNFSDARTSFSRGHALWRAAKDGTNGKTWFSADLNILRQDPASPHPREGATLSASVPLDANANPAGAYLDEDRLAVSAGSERPVLQGATWGSSVSFTHSAERILRGFLVDITNTAGNAAGFKKRIAVSDLYADTHIIWPAKANVRWMLGADALWANGNVDGATFTYTAPLSGAEGPVPTIPAGWPIGILDQRLFLGAYGSTEWRPDPRLTLSAGVRLNQTMEKRDADATVTNTRLSGSLGVLYGLWERGPNHVRVFANARDTFKPAAFDFSLAEGEGVLKPETSRSYEGGFKVRTLDGKLDLEASAFKFDFENLVTSTVINSLPALINAGHTRFQGFELAADLRLANAVFARGTYSAHDAKFVDFVQAFDGVPMQLAGKRVEMSASSLASAGISLSPDEGFVASASLNYTGDRFMNMRNTAPLPGFTTYDVGVGYRTARWEFRIDGKNLGDSRDVVSESEFGDAQYYRMPSRTIRAGMTVKY
jgi:outer membrane receptor protein involved in Fe transport